MSTPFEASTGSSNILRVPCVIREYINEKAASRGFNLEAFSIHRETEPHQVVVELVIGPTGAEQLEPFTVRLTLGDPAAQQVAQALSTAISESEPAKDRSGGN